MISCYFWRKKLYSDKVFFNQFNLMPTQPLSFLFSLLAILIGFSGCSFQPMKRERFDLLPSQSISCHLLQWNKQQKVQLQRHQLIFIDYLEKHPDVKGLVAHHALGSGKTFSAIGFAERNPQRPIIILAPSFLEYHWLEQLEQYGVENKARYRFFKDNAPDILLKENLSNAIVIVDESHRLINNIKGSSMYSNLYAKIQKAHRVILLTATPLYNSIYDLTYQINLSAGKTLLPFEYHKFDRLLFRINPWKSLWRGYIVEISYAKYFINIIFALPLATVLVDNYSLLNGVSITWVFGGLHSLLHIPWILQRLKQVSPFDLKDIQINRLRRVTEKYISYYSTAQDSEAYPKKNFFAMQVHYNHAQMDFLYKFLDERLNTIELKQLLKDNADATNISIEALRLNSSRFHKMLKSEIGRGREIGNFSFIGQTFSLSKQKGKETHLITPTKFEEIFKIIQTSSRPAVIYSHYYHNGLLLFKQFLDGKGYQNQYKILHPEMPKTEYVEAVGAFNRNEIKVLLLHPELTEGISLKGTSQLHFLETPISHAQREQIIGRVVRYQSHAHLPENERYVSVYTWCCKISLDDFQSYFLQRRNWYHQFREFYHGSADARYQIDKSAYTKEISPDTRANALLALTNKQVFSLQASLKIFSIEKYYKTQVTV